MVQYVVMVHYQQKYALFFSRVRWLDQLSSVVMIKLCEPCSNNINSSGNNMTNKLILKFRSVNVVLVFVSLPTVAQLLVPKDLTPWNQPISHDKMAATAAAWPGAQGGWGGPGGGTSAFGMRPPRAPGVRKLSGGWWDRKPIETLPFQLPLQVTR